MKRFIEEYGTIVVTVLVGAIFLAFINGTFFGQLKSQLLIDDSIDKPFFKLKPPSLQGLDDHGCYLAIKIKAGTVFDPIDTEGLLHVRAVDEVDGDLTDKIRVYVVTNDGKKEKKKLITERLDTSGKIRQYHLLYEVTNSMGFQDTRRISVLITEIGGRK